MQNSQVVAPVRQRTRVPEGQAPPQCGPGTGCRALGSFLSYLTQGMECQGVGTAWREASLVLISLLCVAFGGTREREARLRRLSLSAVTLRVEDRGPCARRETKATTKEVAAAGGGGGSFLSNRSSQTLEPGYLSRPLG